MHFQNKQTLCSATKGIYILVGDISRTSIINIISTKIKEFDLHIKKAANQDLGKCGKRRKFSLIKLSSHLCTPKTNSNTKVVYGIESSIIQRN